MKPQENQEWFLGCVEFDVTPKLFTKLRPVARGAADGTCWEQKSGELKEAFQAQGLACWFVAPAGLQKNQLVEFQTAEIAGFDGTNKPDRFQVVHPYYPVVEVIESPVNDEDRLREALKLEGVVLKRPPIGYVIFCLSDKRWLGPFDLVARSPGHWALPADVKLDRARRTSADRWQPADNSAHPWSPAGREAICKLAIGRRRAARDVKTAAQTRSHEF